MRSKNTSIVFLDTKILIEDFQKKNGFQNFSEALRYIIKDYFKKIELREAKDANLENENNFKSAVIEDLNEIKQSIDEVRKMLIVVGHSDDQLRDAFVKYFPKYFKITKI